MAQRERSRIDAVLEKRAPFGYKTIKHWNKSFENRSQPSLLMADDLHDTAAVLPAVAEHQLLIRFVFSDFVLEKSPEQHSSKKHSWSMPVKTGISHSIF